MRLIFVNRFYWPETPATGQLLTDLAEALASRGHEVHVITSHSGAHSLPKSEVQNKVQIRRVRGTRWNKHGIFGKACDFLTFYLGALGQLSVQTRRDTIVIALTDPPLLGIGAAWIAGARGARLVHWVQDVYPELAIELAGQFWLRPAQPLRDSAWLTADRCVTLGEDMASVIAAAGVSPSALSIIPNWAPAGLVPPNPSEVAALRHEWGLDGKFVVAYSGNLGRVHDLGSILALAEALRDDTTVTFAFIGGGAQRTELEATSRQRGLHNVLFFPAQPRERLAVTLGVGDVHLVTVRPGCERLVFPSKLYGICAVGRPVIFIGPAECEIATLVRTAGLGIVGTRENTAELTAGIRRLAANPMERDAFAAAASQFGMRHTCNSAVEQWEFLLAPLGACSRPAPAAVPSLSS